MQEVQEALTVMLCVVTLKTAIETKQQWLGSFTHLQHVTHLQGLTFLTAPEILTRKWSSVSMLGGGSMDVQSSTCLGTVSVCKSLYESEPLCWVVTCLVKWHRRMYHHRVINSHILLSLKQFHLQLWTFLLSHQIWMQHLKWYEISHMDIVVMTTCRLYDVLTKGDLNFFCVVLVVADAELSC